MGWGLSPRDMLMAVLCTRGDLRRAGTSLGWLGPDSQSLCPSPTDMCLQTGGTSSHEHPSPGDDTIVHQQLVLSSATPSLKQPLLGARQGDTLVPVPQSHSLALGLGQSPNVAGLLTARTPSHSRTSSQEPAPGPEARFVQPGNIIKLKLIKHLEKGLH